MPEGAPHALALTGLVLAHCLMSLAWLVGYTALLMQASNSLQRPGIRRGLERVTGVVLIGFGVRVAAMGRH